MQSWAWIGFIVFNFVIGIFNAQAHLCKGLFSQATPVSEVGYSLHRGTDRLPITKEPHRFTVIAKNEVQLALLNKLEGVQTVTHLKGKVYKVSVQPSLRDHVMKTYRNQLAGIAHHAYAIAGVKNVRHYMTDQIILRFNPDARESQQNKVLAQYHLEKISYLDMPHNMVLVRVTKASGANPAKLSHQMISDQEGMLLSAEPNLINRFQRKNNIPHDPLFKNQWYLNAPKDGDELLAGSGVNILPAWQITKGEGVTVAVLDDFPDLAHPDLQSTPHRRVLPLIDFIKSSDQKVPGPEDYHHTPAASVAIGAENNKGIIGVAPQANYLPVRISFAEDDATLIHIFTEVAKQADIMSCSWGPPPIYAPISKALSETFENISKGKLRNQKAFILFSAGNDNAPLRNILSENDPSSSEDGLFLNQKTKEDSWPIWNGLATDPHTFAIGSSTSLKERAAYSNFGNELFGVAPSSNFVVGNPGNRLPGRGVWAADNEANGGDLEPGSIYTDSFGGTSAAAPIAAGVFALILSRNVELNWDTIRKILIQSMDQIVDSSVDQKWNVVLGTYDPKTRHSMGMGYGKFNAARAVQIAEKFARADLSKKATQLATQAITLQYHLNPDQIEKKMLSDPGNIEEKLSLLKILQIEWGFSPKYLKIRKYRKKLTKDTAYFAGLKNFLAKTAYALLFEHFFAQKEISDKEVRDYLRTFLMPI